MTANLHRHAKTLEQRGDLAGALEAYGAALGADPGNGDILADLAMLASRMGMGDAAVSLWGRLAHQEPERIEAVAGLAGALRDLHRYEDAVTVLTPAIEAHPGDSGLWNTLGTVVNQQGDAERAVVFFEEAVKTDPASAPAHYNLGGAHFDLGRLDQADKAFAAAWRLAHQPAQRSMIDFARATLLLALGEIGAGWDAYEVRFDPNYAHHTVLEGAGATWKPHTPLTGRRLLVMGEQGLGDEVMFAGIIPDVLEALGEDGHLTLAVEPRLVELMQRSFPTVRVLAAKTEVTAASRRRWSAETDAEVWAPLGSLARRFRRQLADFPERLGYLTPDPARVAHWRAWLGPAPALGLSWRSGQLTGERRKFYPPLEGLGAALQGTESRLVTLQYDAGQDELSELARIAGAEIRTPPGLDLRNNLDDLAALCLAVDQVVSVPNATAALAGASGANLTLLAGSAASWPMLGTPVYPWYGKARCLRVAAPGQWDEVMQALARQLRPCAP